MALSGTHNARLLRGALVAAIVLGAGAFSLGAAGTPAGPQAPAACDTSPATLADTIQSVVEVECKSLSITANTTVSGSGHLRIFNSTVAIDGGKSIKVLAGARLTIRDSSLSVANTGSGALFWGLVAETETTLLFERVSARGFDSLHMRAKAFNASDLHLAQFGGAALLAVGANITLLRTRISDGPVGLVLRQGTDVQAAHLTLSNLSVAGIDAAASTLEASEILMDGVITPLLVGADAKVRLDGLQLEATPREAQMAPGAGLLELFDPEPLWSTDNVTFSDVQSLARFGGLPRVRVVDDANGNPVSGATIQFRNDTSSAPFATLVTNAEGLTPPIRLVAKTLNKTEITTASDPFLVAREMHNVATGALPLGLIRAGFVHEVRLERTPDTIPPGWEGPNVAPLSAPAWNATGFADLRWDAAIDPGGANHAVSHYLLYRFPSHVNQAPSVRTVFGTSRAEPLGGVGPVGFRVQPVDLAGNQGNVSNLVHVRHDTQPPWIQVAYTGTPGPHPEWFRSAKVVVKVDVRDNQSGFHSLRDRVPTVVGCGAPTATNNTVREFTEEALHTIQLRVCDIAGHVVDKDIRVGIDREVPDELKFRLDPPRPDGRGDWYARPVMLLVEANDAGSGIQLTRYRLSATGSWTDFKDNTTISTGGSHVLTVNATDRAGNARLAQQRLQIDTQAPALADQWDGPGGEAGWARVPVVVRLTASDAESGVDELSYRTSTTDWVTSGENLTFPHEADTLVRFRVADAAGNEYETPWKALRVDLEPPIPPTAILKPPAPGEDTYVLDWSGATPVDAMSGIDRIEVHRRVGAEDLRRVATLPGDAQSTSVPLQVGATNTFVARAIDGAGWTADSLPASVFSANGTAGSLLGIKGDYPKIRGVKTFTAAPADPKNVTSVTYYLDGVLQTATASAPYEWRWDSAQATNGRHEILVVTSRSDGSSFEETYVVRAANGYTDVLEDRFPLMAPIVVASLVGVGVAARGLRTLRQEALDA